VALLAAVVRSRITPVWVDPDKETDIILYPQNQEYSQQSYQVSKMCPGFYDFVNNKPYRALNGAQRGATLAGQYLKERGGFVEKQKN